MPSRVIFSSDDGSDESARDDPAEVLAARRPVLPAPVRRLATRHWVRWTAAAVVLVAAVTVGVVLWQRHDDAREQARRAALVAPVRTWVANSRADSINTTTTGSGLDCPSVDGRSVSPARRVSDTLRAGLPGYGSRATVETIDQAGHLCMLQVSVVSGATIVVLRVQPRSDVEVGPTPGGEVTGSGTGKASAGVVAVAAHGGRVVALGWTGPSPPASTTLRRLVVAEARHW